MSQPEVYPDGTVIMVPEYRLGGCWPRMVWGHEQDPEVEEDRMVCGIHGCDWDFGGCPVAVELA